jgi:hydrophobic/amphiphilic exporter-1 (mainly G- bacteria), HAE1 family
MSIDKMIGIIMLRGLVTKNALLLVDYANTLRSRDGLESIAATLKAGPTRLRPIRMTTPEIGSRPCRGHRAWGRTLR